ncbi:MAG: glycosyl hydrolase family 18 protein, partial [Myxococcota bacterium]
PDDTVPPHGGPDLWSYGYVQATHADPTRVPFHALSHVALFAAHVDATGTLRTTDQWARAEALVAAGRPYGVRVHLVVACFEPKVLDRLLGHSSARSNLIVALQRWLDRTGAHGVNLDFEGLPRSRRRAMFTFVRELEAAVDEVVVAVPAVDHRGAWDLQGLSRHADLYVMAYDYHWAGSSHAGPVDPLRAGPGTVWQDVNPWSIARTIDDVLAAGADPAHLILGLPLYGRRWPVTGDRVPAPTTGRGQSVTFEAAWQDARGRPRRVERDSASRVVFDGDTQLWFGDEMTVRQRLREIRQKTTWAGVGFWSLGYVSDPGFWSAIAEERRVTDERPTRDPASRWIPLASFLMLLGGLLVATSTPWTRWYSGRRGETR